MFKFHPYASLLLCSVLSLLVSCTVHPPGERDEREAAKAAGKPFEKKVEDRVPLPLPEKPTPDDLVQYALLNNADLEQDYWQWRSAIEQIPQDGSQTATLNVAFGSTITNGKSNWRDDTLTFANDPMTDIKWPGKLDAAARQALENAKAAGVRFAKARFELRNKVLSAYYDYALTAELIRLEQSNLQLLAVTETLTEARSRAGAMGQADVLKAKNELDLSNNQIENMESQLPAERAALNALLGRSVEYPLAIPKEMPDAVKLKASDSQLLDLAAQRNPELKALADEIRGRKEGVELAKLQYVPDFNLSAGTDLAGMTQSVLGQATVPFFRYEALNAAIDQAKANLRAAEAMRRQTENDIAAKVVMDITIIHDADRQLELFDGTILPRSSETVSIDRSGYETGRTQFMDLLGDEQKQIDIERTVAGLKSSRAKSIAELESITLNRIVDSAAERNAAKSIR